MASGNTLVVFTPQHNAYPASNPATPGRLNDHPYLAFDQATQEIALFGGVVPYIYSGGGITVICHWMAVPTTGTVGWDVAFENLGGVSLASNGYATAATITAATVPGVTNTETTTQASIADGTDIDDLAGGDLFRLRIRRDVANDSAAGDARLLAVELVET